MDKRRSQEKMKKLDLSEIRDRIDKIDSSLVELLEERMKIVEDVARYKKENNMKIFDPKREEEVIQKNTDRVKNNELKKYIEKILNDIMSVSKEYQESKLYERDKATFLHAISLGNLGDLHKLLIVCTRYAIENDIETVKLTFYKNLCIIKIENESHESGCRRNR